MDPTEKSTGETEELLTSLAFSAGFEALSVDFDRGVWILRVDSVDHDQLEIFTLSLENLDLKHVAVEFVK